MSLLHHAKITVGQTVGYKFSNQLRYKFNQTHAVGVLTRAVAVVAVIVAIVVTAANALIALTTVVVVTVVAVVGVVVIAVVV